MNNMIQQVGPIYLDILYVSHQSYERVLCLSSELADYTLSAMCFSCQTGHWNQQRRGKD